MIRSIAIALIGVFALLTNYSFAQEIIVEAARINADQADPSRSVTVLSGEALAANKALSVADVLRNVPGVQLTRQGSVGQTASVFIRGARSEGTLVLIDGVEVNDASSPAGGFDFSTLSVSHIERIEIYRGPQSVRFGPGALGGVIHIVTKEARLGKTSAGYRLEAGSFSTERASLQTSSASNTVGFSGAIDSYRSDGFSSAAGGAEDDGAKVYTAVGNLTWRPSSTAKGNAILRYVDADVDIDRGGGASNDDPNADSKSSQWMTGLSLSDRFFGERLKTSLGLYLNQARRNLRNLPDSLSTTESRDDFKSRNYKAESNSDLLLGERHTLRLGLQWRKEEADSTSVLDGVATSVPDKTLSVLGESLTYLYESETWFYDMGLRQDSSSGVGSIWSSRASLGRQISKSKVTSTFGTGFKLPSLYQRYSAFGDPHLKEEKAQTLDLSLEQRFSDRAVMLVTLFKSRYSNLIDYDMTMNRYYNVLEAESQGVESRFSWAIDSSYKSELEYTYLDAKDKTTGLELLRRPHHSGSFSVSRTSRILELYLKYRYRGSRPDIDPSGFQRMEQSSYDVWELGSYVNIDNLFKVTARIENVFERKYQEVAGYGTPPFSIYLGLAGEL